MDEDSEYQSIDCSDYDFVEIACMDHYDVEVVTKDGIFFGRAETTVNDGSGEFLQMRATDGKVLKIRLDTVRRLLVRTRPSRFESHDFAANS